MPIIVNSQTSHPFLPSLGSLEAIEQERARRQDIRPLEIAILNLMADKLATERQLAQWLGNSILQVRLTFVATDAYMQAIAGGRQSRTTPAAHIRDFYKSWSEIKERRFDGLIVTGVNALQPRVTDETIWPEVQRILEWSSANVFASLFLCWGAKAALKHFHDIDSMRAERKLFGLFEHSVERDLTGILAGLPDRFPVPVSRWKSPDAAAIAACPALETVARSDESGPNILAETARAKTGEAYARRLYIVNHPEYETDSLALEYHRDAARDPATPLPLNYFPENDPIRMPHNSWRHTASIYSNWIRQIYEAVPYEWSGLQLC